MVLVLILFGYSAYLKHRLDRHLIIMNYMSEHEQILGKTLIDLMKALGVGEEESEEN